MTAAQPNPLVSRIVHLSGGLRCFALGRHPIFVGTFEDHSLCPISSPSYADLYAVLKNLNLSVIGSDFISSKLQLIDICPFEWEPFNPLEGFFVVDATSKWADVKHAPNQDTPEIIDFSSRIVTYQRLLSLRLKELSVSYNQTLRAQLLTHTSQYKEPSEAELFNNEFVTYIDAGIHAFLADAASFRDLISEAIWKLILKETDNEVRTLTGLLKKTKGRDHPLLDIIRAGAADGGWLKNLTDLRNAIVHIAPIAASNELHMVEMRIQKVAEKNIPYLHYPLTDQDGGMRLRPDRLNFSDKIRLSLGVNEYRSFVEKSGDALVYAARTFYLLVKLAESVRLASGLKSQVFKLTDENIISMEVTRI